MGRLQAGGLYVTEPWVFAAGATGEIGGLADAGIGGQLSITHLRTGVWGHAGASWTTGEPMTSIAAGVTLLGVEWQRQIGDDATGDDATGDAFLLHLRIPIGTTAFLLTHDPT